MTADPSSRSTAIVMAGASFGLQIVTAVALMIEVSSAGFFQRDSTSGILFALAAFIPLLAQGLICWMKNEPIIQVSSLITSVIILAAIVHDLTVPGYVPLGLIASWPVVLLVMSCGNVLAWIHESRDPARKRISGPDC